MEKIMMTDAEVDEVISLTKVVCGGLKRLTAIASKYPNGNDHNTPEQLVKLEELKREVDQCERESDPGMARKFTPKR